MRNWITGMALALALPAMAAADGVKLYDFDGDFEDAKFGVESAIVDRGLVIDYVSHVGTMLERTRTDVGGKMLFKNADIFIFCSAVLSRKVMEADPLNIAHCPYGIFVAEDVDGNIQVGFRDLPDGPMAEVEALLDGIVQEAVGN